MSWLDRLVMGFVLAGIAVTVVTTLVAAWLLHWAAGVLVTGFLAVAGGLGYLLVKDDEWLR